MNQSFYLEDDVASAQKAARHSRVINYTGHGLSRNTISIFFVVLYLFYYFLM